MRKDNPAMPNSSPAEAAEPKLASQGLSSQQVEVVYQEYSRDLSAFLIGVLRDRDLALDALQQTFQRVAEVGDTARTETFRGWLFQVAFREAMLIRRRQQQDVRHREAWWTAAEMVRDQASPADQLVTTEEIERLQRAVAALPADQRLVVERRIQQNETFAEIAAYLGIPLGTVLTRMRIAMQKLRQQLQDR